MRLKNLIITMEKTHWKKLVNPDYIGVYSLPEGKDMIVTIETVVRQLVVSTNGKKEECTVAKLIGQKPFIINRTNAKTISKIYGTPYIEDWAGKTIQLFASVTKLAGDDVECLRIRPQIPVTETAEQMKKFVIDKCIASEAIKNNILTNLSLGSLDDLSTEQIKTIYLKLKK